MNKKRSETALVVGVIAVIGSVIGGCIDTDTEEMSTEIDSIKEMVSMVPSTSEIFRSFDFHAIRGEPELAEFYSTLTKEPDALLIHYNDVETVGVSSSATGKFYIAILKGQIDEAGATGDCETSEHYMDVEIYGECEGRYDSKETRAILGEEMVLQCVAEDREMVKKAISIIRGKTPSLYDHEIIREIVNRLPPGGFMTTIQRGEASSYYGSIAMGFTTVEDTGDTVRFTIILAFENEKDAASNGDDLLQGLTEGDVMVSDLVMSQDGTFIELTGTVAMHDLAAFLGYAP